MISAVTSDLPLVASLRRIDQAADSLGIVQLLSTFLANIIRQVILWRRREVGVTRRMFKKTSDLLKPC